MNSANDRGHPLLADSVCTALGDEHRRAILRELHDSGESVLAVEELANRVAERVADGEPPGPDARNTVRTALHHNHLPRLAEDGLIVYDGDDGEVWNAVGQPTRQLLRTLESPEFRD